MDFTRSRLFDLLSSKRFWAASAVIFSLLFFFSAFDVTALSCNILARDTQGLGRAYCTPSFRFTPQWKKVDNTTLKFEGAIRPDSYTDFEKVFTPEITTVQVNSIKGDYRAAFQIGQKLQKQGVTVVVQQFCTAACANYWFLAGKTKVLDGGVVGFQGNYTAVAAQLTDDQIRENLKTEFKSTTGTPPTTDQMNTAFKRFKEFLQQEKAFFQAAGVDQAFFDLSQKEDKGAGDGQKYIYLIPGRKLMEQHGVSGLQGDQSQERLKILAQAGDMHFKE
ncbi:hypothetical protein [Deinococcus misasensis]|uniref:hypothetical protein n=1 Tax=Deinococcus misasensis TaxID=392413 RepID=UPI000556A06B|nr:hypothetical protein [Deinococcus misasensis]